MQKCPLDSDQDEECITCIDFTWINVIVFFLKIFYILGSKNVLSIHNC